MTKFRRIKWAKPQATGITNQATIVLADGRAFSATSTQVTALNTEKKLREALVAVFGDTPDIFLHLNRNGRWAIATGEAPKTWPEDDSTK